MRPSTTEPADAAYQGQAGAYSEGAARALCGPGATLLPRETLSEVFEAVETGRACWGVVPIENTLSGAVPGVVPLLLAGDLTVHAQVVEPIDHVLAAPPGCALEDVREALSHPVALAQCSRFFQAHPAIRPVPVFDTAGALEMVMREPAAARAAIAGRAAAALHGAAVLAEHLQDHRENYTRFVKIGRGPAQPGGTLVHVMLGVRLPHTPGALAAVLRTLADSGANLTRIDSAPIHGNPFEYEFLIEGIVAGDWSTAALPGADVREIGRLSPAVRRAAGGDQRFSSLAIASSSRS